MPGKSSRRKHKGGNAPSPSSYSSASSYGSAVNGSGDSQYDRVFNQGGKDGAFQSNAIIGVQGQRAGRRGRSRRSRGSRGGFWGQVINQAIVPFSILGMQQTYNKKTGGKRTRQSKSHKRH